MEVSIFFYHVLRGLGLEAYMTGVRIRPRVGGVPQGDYMGWVHIVNIVTLDDGTKYMLDVAFGGDGATKPIPLVDGQITPNIGTQELRLVHDRIPQQSSQSQRWWIYQYRNGVEKEWNSFYCFSETEFLHQDFEIMSYFASTSKQSFQTFKVLVVKFLRGESEDDEVYGKVMLVDGEVKINTDGKTRVAKMCRTEEERIDALKEYFGITLEKEEREGIKGMSTELSRK